MGHFKKSWCCPHQFLNWSPTDSWKCFILPKKSPPPICQSRNVKCKVQAQNVTFLDWQIDGGNFWGFWSTSKSQLVANSKLGQEPVSWSIHKIGRSYITKILYEFILLGKVLLKTKPNIEIIEQNFWCIKYPFQDFTDPKSSHKIPFV